MRTNLRQERTPIISTEPANPLPAVPNALDGFKFKNKEELALTSQVFKEFSQKKERKFFLFNYNGATAHLIHVLSRMKITELVRMTNGEVTFTEKGIKFMQQFVKEELHVEKIIKPEIKCTGKSSLKEIVIKNYI